MFANSNFELISDLISNVDWIQCFSNKNVQEMFDELIFYTEVACYHFTPIKKTFSSLKIRPAWVNARLKFLIRSKQNLRYKNCSCKWKDPVLKTKYKMICKNVADEIKKVRQNFEFNLVKRAIMNPKLLYSYMNNQQAVKDTIKDLPETLKNLTKLYADDTKILNEMLSSASTLSLQSDLDLAFKWTQDQLVKFNISKCMVMYFGRNNKKSSLYINDQKLNITESESYLGIIFSSNLKWKNHVVKCVGKVNQMLGRYRKCFVCLDIRLLRILYVSFVQPLLEFAVQVWSPIRKREIELLERDQHRATQLIPSLKISNYEYRLKALDLTTLTQRRQRGDMIQLFKFFNVFNDLETIKKISIQQTQTRGHSLKYVKEITKQACRENFLFNRSANLWNSLQSELVKAQSVNSFKAGLDCWMSSNQASQLS
ncbi:uncharacterized protein LOC136074142 [Hydra vulgaris]|uniref:Uncharacterized protein LOC136074142 n=1 Tax=Hydra vulgaris TaxID=6087 RepID=A0ABM4B156_HYDVU